MSVCACVCVCVCARLPWRPCGANATAGWSHLTNHDIMVSTGPFPSLLALSSALPLSLHSSPLTLNFLSLEGRASRVCTLPICCISLFPLFLFLLFRAFFSVALWSAKAKKKKKGGRKSFKRTDETRVRKKKRKTCWKRNEGRMVGLGHSEQDWCLLLPGTALTEAHPQQPGNQHMPTFLSSLPHTHTHTHTV